MTLSEDEVSQPMSGRRVNQAVGLLVMGAGIALLILVFVWAFQLYSSIGPAMFSVQPVTMSSPQVSGTTAAKPLPGGSLQAKPEPKAAVQPNILSLVAQLATLLVMGWLAGLLASKGVALATRSAMHT